VRVDLEDTYAKYLERIKESTWSERNNMSAQLVNADFEQRVVLSPPALEDWVRSPMAGVLRRPLDRVGLEIARATSLVRYLPGSQFKHHTHGGGEEILVLEGVFSDELGDYPAGTYLRNPPGTGHAPHSRDGCTLFVKLWQFTSGDLQPVRIDTRSTQWRPGLVPGLSVMPLHEFDGISTALVRWAPDTQFNPHSHPGGEEILVLEGLFRDELGTYPAGTWLRSPRWSRHTPYTAAEGAVIYVKVGHLGAKLLALPAG
jgi:anti-sigma factor ChrR (cupin superfamily)